MVVAMTTTIIDPSNIDDDDARRGRQWVTTTASTRGRTDCECDAGIGRPYSWITPDDVSSFYDGAPPPVSLLSPPGPIEDPPPPHSPSHPKIQIAPHRPLRKEERR